MKEDVDVDEHPCFLFRFVLLPLCLVYRPSPLVFPAQSKILSALINSCWFDDIDNYT